MKNLYSVWLVPQDNDEQYLRNIIDKLATKYNSSSFIPHIALLPDNNLSLERLQQIIKQVFEHQKPFEVVKIGVNQTDDFWKTVFLEFELNETLKKLFEDINAKTNQRDISVFKPHVSLIYKTMAEDERVKIAKNIQTKDKFMFDRVFVVTPKERDEDFLDIPHWRFPYEKSLNDF